MRHTAGDQEAESGAHCWGPEAGSLFGKWAASMEHKGFQVSPLQPRGLRGCGHCLPARVVDSEPFLSFEHWSPHRLIYLSVRHLQ